MDAADSLVYTYYSHHAKRRDLVILSGLTKVGDEYVGGQILDPGNGKVHRSKLRLTDNGTTLSVRGYIGAPMLGRSQTWVRQE
jgi:uncharacterized protein (DUF2147 family)